MNSEGHWNGRDLFWCWNMNEPFLLEFHGNLYGEWWCPNCKQVFDETDNHSHRFMFHVLKPGCECPQAVYVQMQRHCPKHEEGDW